MLISPSMLPKFMWRRCAVAYLHIAVLVSFCCLQ
jgi:hypothetical protein